MSAMSPTDFDIGDITRYTEALAEVVASADPATPVSTCGEWTMYDLAVHMHEVQYFWRWAITNRPASPESYDPPDPPLVGEAAAALRSVCADLVAELRAADPADEAWSWSEDHTVGFTIRRQIHEAIIHAIDGHLATGEPPWAVDSALAADGVAELVDVMLSGIPSWATFVPSVQVVQLCTTDTDDCFTLSLGTLSGTSTESGVTHEGLAAAERISDDVAGDITIAGPALDLLLWMWGRGPLECLDVTGEASIADALRELVVSSTQ